MMHITKQKIAFAADWAQVIEVRVYPTYHEFLNGDPDNTLRIHRSEGKYWQGDSAPANVRIYASDFFEGNFIVMKFKNSYTSLHGDMHQNFYRVKASKNSDGLVTDLTFEEMFFDLMPVGIELPSEPERAV
jgi:hypothetical protein